MSQLSQLVSLYIFQNRSDLYVGQMINRQASNQYSIVKRNLRGKGLSSGVANLSCTLLFSLTNAGIIKSGKVVFSGLLRCPKQQKSKEKDIQTKLNNLRVMVLAKVYRACGAVGQTVGQLVRILHDWLVSWLVGWMAQISTI